MTWYRVDAVVGEGRVLLLDTLPFSPGQRVRVTTDLAPNEDGLDDPARYSLRGMYSHYERPTDPVVEDDWEAAQP